MGIMIIYITAAVIGKPVTIVPAVFAVRVVKDMIGTMAVIGIIIIAAIPPGAIIISVPVFGVIAVITPKLPVAEKSPFPIANLTFRDNHRVLFSK